MVDHTEATAQRELLTGNQHMEDLKVETVQRELHMEDLLDELMQKNQSDVDQKGNPHQKLLTDMIPLALPKAVEVRELHQVRKEEILQEEKISEDKYLRSKRERNILLQK